MYFIYMILVGLVAGWATGKIMKGSGYGILMDIVLGIAGAIVGGWIMSFLGLPRQIATRASSARSVPSEALAASAMNRDPSA